MNRSRLQIAKKDILSLFDALPRTVFKRSDIDRILFENRQFWRLAQSMGTSQFIAFLQQSGKLIEHTMKFPHRTETRYTWGEVADLQIIQTLRPESYFTHFTALFLHRLTLQIPKTVYLNYEQPQKRQALHAEPLVQERIDYAFRAPCRVSKTVAEFREKKICLLNGKFTGRTGVVEVTDQVDGNLHVTDLERTLIDAAVRPVYAGGVHTVLEAYRNAKDKVSINRLAAMLTNLGYIYPYHQAIGFYLERAGNYSARQLSLMHRFEMQYDFYLTHQMKERE